MDNERCDGQLAKKFEGDGVQFKGKLLGIDPVSAPRGDKMCQNAMQRLKAIAKKAKGTHKERVTVSISLDGIKVCNAKTNDVISHQKINLISYISRDSSDIRSFGYVYGSPETGHQFIGLKIEKTAVPVMKTIGELFKYVYEKRQEEKSDNDGNKDGFADAFYDVDISGNKEPRKASGIVSADEVACKKQPVENRYASWEAFNDDVESKAVPKVENVAVRKAKTEFPTLPLPLSPKRHRNKKCVDMESPFGLTSSTEFEKESPIPNIFESSLSDVMFTNVTTPSNPDRYAAFSEINSTPSLFDSFVTPTNDVSNDALNVAKSAIDLNSSTVSSPDLWNKALESSQSSINDINLFASLPSPPKPKRSPHLKEPEVMFADLDPLGSIDVEQYFDKNVFFQVNKKPSLNDLDNGSLKSLDSSLNEDKFHAAADPFGNSFNKNVCTNSAFVSLSSSSSPQLTEGRPSSSASVVSRNPFVSETSSESSYDLSYNDCVLASPTQRMCANNSLIGRQTHHNSEITFEDNRSAFMATIRKPLSPFNPFSDDTPQPPPRPPPRDATPTHSPPPIPPRPSSSTSNCSTVPPPPLPKRKSVVPFAMNSTYSQLPAMPNVNPFVPAIPSPLRKTKQRTQLLMNKHLNKLPEKKIATEPREPFDPFNSSFVDCKLSQLKVNSRSESHIDERIPLVTLHSNVAESQAVNGSHSLRETNSLAEQNSESCESPREAKPNLVVPKPTTVTNYFPNGGTTNYCNLQEEHISPPERNIFKGSNVDPFADDEFFK